MKKIAVLAVALLGTALFFGCSNSSDGATPIIPSGGGSGLPASVGTNELKGKSFDFVSGNTAYGLEFYANTYYDAVEVAHPEEPNVNTAYKEVNGVKYSYTYNSKTQQVFAKYVDSFHVLLRGEATIDSAAVYPEPNFTNDAGFIAWQKEVIGMECDLLTPEQVEESAKVARYHVFQNYGYDDNTGAREVSDQIIADYNEAQKLVKQAQMRLNKLIGIKFYKFEGNGLYFFEDYRVPKGATLSSLYKVYDFTATISTGSDDWYLSYSGGLEPEIRNSTETEAYSVSSITKNAINTSAHATRGDAFHPWDFTEEERSFKYTTTKDDGLISFEIEGLGLITLVYASDEQGMMPSTFGKPKYTPIQD